MKKVALISGGLGGVGRATAQALAHDGWSLGLLYKTTPQSEAEAFIARLPGTHFVLHCDIAQFEEARQAIQKIEHTFGVPSLFIHAASDKIIRKKIAATTPEEFRGQFEASVFGAFNLTSLLLPRMKESGGLIIGITTEALEDDEPGTLPGYIAAKHALRAYLRETARECKDSPLRVCAIAPDLMQTKLTADLPSQLFSWMARNDARGRLTTPEDVAEKIMFLLSPEGEKLNSITIAMPDGTIKPL